jgi:acyl transferase domain-containing protein
MLVEGRSAPSEFPSDHLNANAHCHEDRTRLDRLSTKGGHFMKEDPGLFDAAFFSINAAEAGAMDPQQVVVFYQPASHQSSLVTTWVMNIHTVP